jgi:hypothetical protein
MAKPKWSSAMNQSHRKKKCHGNPTPFANEPADINQACHGNMSGVSNHGGHVIANPKMVLIFWDEYFASTPDAVSAMRQFVSELVSGPYMLGLGQYGVGQGAVVETVVINMSAYPAPNPSVPFSEKQLAAQLITWLSLGVVAHTPASNETDLVYLIFPPSKVILSDNGSTDIGGYHKHNRWGTTGDDNLFWATVQYYLSATPELFVDSISLGVSHELVETFSNRDSQGVFTDDGHGCEIGDLCEQDASGNIIESQYLQWQVEKYWSQKHGQCVAPTGPGYQLRGLETGIDLQQTEPSQFVFLLAPNLDLYAIMMNGTQTGKTEVHVITAASNYQSRALETGIDLQPTAPSQFAFQLAPNLDLYAIMMNGTQTGKTEVHVITAASNYQSRGLETGIDLPLTVPSQFVFLLAPNLDLYAIMMNGTQTGKTEVHVFTAASNYQSPGLQTPINLQPTNPSQFVFLLAPNLDLYAIMMNGTGTMTTEAHVFTAASNYQNKVLETGTSLASTSPSQFVFQLASNLDLYAIMMNGTGTGKTEVHVLKPDFA